MGIIRDWLRGDDNPLFAAAESGPTFAVDSDSIPPGVVGLMAYDSVLANAPKVTRQSAMQVPAVKRSRDLIAGTLGALPLDQLNGNRSEIENVLMDQPERNRGRVVTMTLLIEDLLLESVAWWRIVEFHSVGDLAGYPARIKRLKPSQVTVNHDTGKVYVDGNEVGSENLIRFDSPTDGLLTAGARAIRTCLTLDTAAASAADGTPPVDYFTPADDVDPFEDDKDTTDFLDGWQDKRRSRRTAYVPAALDYKISGWNPKDLQLAEARQHAVLEIARLAGVDPEELGVSTTSRTYANQFDRRKAFLDFTLGMYRQAVEDRLSMPDVSPRGYYVKFNLDSFLRSSTKERYETYAIGLDVGAIDPNGEVRDLEDKPRLSTPAPRRLALAPPLEDNAVSASDPRPPITFDASEPEIRMDMPHAEAFSVDYAKRTISGMVVPYGVVGISNGQRWVFSQGSLKFSDPKRVKLWIQHNKDDVRGHGLTFDDRPDGMWATFQVEEGEAGDEALRKADPAGSATWDAFSIGLKQGGKFRTVGGINYAIEAPWMETSLTPAPSFDDARVHAVAADATNERHDMLCSKCGQIHAAGIVECDAAAVASFSAANDNDSGPDFSGITDAIVAGFDQLQNPQGREIIDAGGSLEINEALPYRFDGIAGAHSFSADLRASASGDAEAKQRLDGFMDEAFAVTSSNTAALNPTQSRPELYVPNLEFTRPLYSLVSTGTVADKTPFTVPKFNSASGLVGPHTEGTEPTPGAFSATNQTITPTATSGKIEINREVWDQGGSPQADAIIWREMLNGYYEAGEAKIAAMLNALTLTEINLASAVDEALVTAVEGIFIDLQFVRGGNRYSSFALDGPLFKALTKAKDTTGRKLLPIIGPANADGSVSGNFSEIAVGSQRGKAAWALGASGNTTHSYLFVPSSVWYWSSAPKRFTFEYQVKSVDMAIWGYDAGAVLRDTDVKRIDYTTSDA